MRSGKKPENIHGNVLQPGKNKLVDIIELAELGKKANVVFHDLANHITALTLSIGHLEDSFARDSERLREYSKRSGKTRIQMEQMTKILRAHIERERNTVFYPAREIEFIIRTLKHKAVREKIEFIFQPDKTIKMKGSSKAFFHITTNLISNAIESFEAVKNRVRPTINIVLSQTSDEMVLSVSDNGSGIAPQNIKRIFEPSFTTKRNGHGIGLSATKEYVENAFGGQIRVSSSRFGTTFSVHLPKQRHNQKKIIDNLATQTKQNRKRLAPPAFVF